MTPPGPLYPLDEVVELARQGKVGFQRSAQLDIVQELGMTLDQAKEVVAWLTLDEFQHTIKYSDQLPAIELDVYFPRRRLPNGTSPPLYLKFRLTRRPVAQVFIASFHKQRPT